MKRRWIFAVAAAALTALACVTINITFPEAAIKDLSKQIEDEIAKQAKQKEAPPPAEKKEEPAPAKSPSAGPSAGLLDELLGVAYAADVPSPGVTNPAIRRIIDARAARAGELEKFKDMGAVGENNKGLLEVRALDAVADLRARAALQKLVREENADREELYKEIAVAQGVQLSELPKIRATYAATLRENAKPGQWIQLPDGVWKRK